MFGSNPSKKTEVFLEKKLGPKRDSRTNRPEPKRLMDLPHYVYISARLIKRSCFSPRLVLPRCTYQHQQI